MRRLFAFAALLLGIGRASAQTRPVDSSKAPAPQDAAALASEIAKQRDQGNTYLPNADHFTFGQPIYQSQLIATVMAVPGVQQVNVQQFCRFDTTPSTCVEEISAGPLEIVRLDNDEAAPYNGILTIHIEGDL